MLSFKYEPINKQKSLFLCEHFNRSLGHIFDKTSSQHKFMV